MRKLCCMIALAAISFGSVYAAAMPAPVKAMQVDTTKVKKKKDKTKVKMKDTTKTKKDTTKKM
ncbi:hypothetical protein HDF18_18775 [Mucilaginibacter sp. X5P1]|uniref:hypothetical protein n=1 Tax=Mucilaginibacter sp. X5P1 TaxID=2723088 RepID=UPI00160D4557|nr:hypothetical protein [Mucilaginibacter sp. X5P1]MBB6139691.1 hypothetical protein [Mucilaginibacter sp. X5P1]